MSVASHELGLKGFSAADFAARYPAVAAAHDDMAEFMTPETAANWLRDQETALWLEETVATFEGHNYLPNEVKVLQEARRQKQRTEAAKYLLSRVLEKDSPTS